ncbi:late competence protein ComER [Chengkuizengella axinellae]|uniref:Pyrroline-5-carboxylate reductase n=1 Tax=Chengkuizengella axinellae TaxID=3064388 RepID=A0ABT9IUK1_9BACL|nr:late competence protein ComER [Chengkuizengella sp. 2205SS18-9]MDP5273038.1 late competence protein ComER [Chengkuizengella sp. 2205SS18-9]
MNLGFIGTGSMGSILIEAFIQSEALEPKQIAASNRTKSKTQKLTDQYPDLRIYPSNIEVALESDIIFICVKPLEFKNVIDEIKNVLLPSQIIVSITSPILIKHLEDQLPCKIAKIIPSITNHECSGASLCMYGNKITEEDKQTLEELLKPISEPLRISEKFTRVTSDISSCGPAFLAFFIQNFVEAAVKETGIPREEATRLASEMVLGTGKLLTSGGFTPETLTERVCVPGGITAEGIKLMSNELDGVFNQLIQTTHAKYEEDLNKVESMFYDSSKN